MYFITENLKHKIVLKIASLELFIIKKYLWSHNASSKEQHTSLDEQETSEVLETVYPKAI